MPGMVMRRPLATRTKSALFFRVSIAGVYGILPLAELEPAPVSAGEGPELRRLGAEALSPARAPGGPKSVGRPWSLCAPESRGGACAQDCWAEKDASLGMSLICIAWCSARGRTPGRGRVIGAAGIEVNARANAR